MEGILKNLNNRKRLLFSSQDSPLPVKTLATNFNEKKLIDCLTYVDYKVMRLRSTEYNPVHLFNFDISDLLKRSHNDLGDVDKYKLITFDSHYHEKNENFEIGNLKMWFFVDMILAVEQMRLLPVMEKLTEEDKETVFKHTAITITYFIECYYSYIKNWKTIVCPDGLIPIKVDKHMQQIHVDLFVRVMEPFFRVNPTKEEYSLTKAIIVCNPDIPGISSDGQTILAEHRRQYVSAMLLHEQLTHGTTSGANRFSQLLFLIESMIHFTAKQREFHRMHQIKVVLQKKVPYPQMPTFKICSQLCI
ncbi:hypothetical protein FO519_006241 [Halicephalobus sp. NKZ332]|nr:hypothetical protein FO519_006241 [Halicephalobus sp. NKZ332]